MMFKKAILLSITPLCLQASALQEAEQKAHIIFDLLRNAAHSSYIGESITQQQHALQAAFHAQQKNGSDELIIACLLHDIGHQLPGRSMDGWGIEDHEQIGADFLKSLGFSDTVCQLAAGHVDAKRYLCATDPDYYAQLSDASKQTLTFQDAIMNKQEQEQFQQNPLFKEMIILRNCDDLAKDPNANVPGLEEYWQMVVNHLHRQLIQAVD